MSHRAKLKWRCRRGMRELDLILEGFLAAHYDRLTPAAKVDFEELLAQSNDDLLTWLVGGQKPANESLARIAAQVRDAGEATTAPGSSSR